MRYRISFVGASAVQGVEFDADVVAFEKDGSVQFFAHRDFPAPDAARVPGYERDFIIAYNRDVWRSVTAVGAFNKATVKAPEVKPNETAPSRQQAREAAPS